MRDAKLIELPPIDVKVRKDRVTPLNDQAVAVIRQSVAETGEIRDPIHVREMRNGYELIDGRHRLEVARILELPTVTARVWQCTLEEARLMEADANVTFTHMSPIDLAVSLAGRKSAYERLHPETRAGAASTQARMHKRTEMSFCNFVAEIIGVTPRQIRRVIAAGEALRADDVLNLRAAPGRVAMNDLYQIAKIGDEAEHRFVIDAITAGRDRNAAAARRRFKTGQLGIEPPVKTAVDKAHDRLLDAWTRASATARQRFVRDCRAELEDVLAEVPE
ncbi:ParB N-terminal domain-containing protein [Pseudoruegeria sp. HB172150]|uniref:ParB/RepB/Spo0J family partition protein n=1 Tax=Pseudoruegeria sp. HB172150 TaxID=2721164 RepID=UPI001554345E|nr:ParB N-terminal domain-containing protein [Pseudoruegeria sp. HB172150]